MFSFSRKAFLKKHAIDFLFNILCMHNQRMKAGKCRKMGSFSIEYVWIGQTVKISDYFTSSSYAVKSSRL